MYVFLIYGVLVLERLWVMCALIGCVSAGLSAAEHACGISAAPHLPPLLPSLWITAACMAGGPELET